MTGESPSPKTGRRAVVEIPNSAGEIMTKDVVSALVGTSVRDVAILLLEKRISAIPVLAANLQLVGMVSEGDLIGRSDADRVARRDWWLTLLRMFSHRLKLLRRWPRDLSSKSCVRLS